MPKQLYTIENGKLRLFLHHGQSLGWKSDSRIISLVGGAQSGKTSFGGFWLNREIQKCGSGDYLAVAANFGMFKLKMLPEMLQIFVHVLRIGRYWPGEKVIEIKNPYTNEFQAKGSTDPMYARIILRSADAESGLESSTCSAAWLDEAGLFSLGAWEAIQRRVALKQGRVLITTTPYAANWLKYLIIDKADGKFISVINFPSTANPSFPQEEFDRLREILPPWKFKLFYEGIFTNPPGIIYGDFKGYSRNEGGHLVSPFKIPEDWNRFVGIDPGSTNTASVWLAHDKKEDVYYLYRTTHEGGKSTPEHAQNAEAYGENVVNYFIGQKAEVQQRMDWIAAGVTNVKEPNVHDVESGIDRVIQLFRTNRLFIFDTEIGILDQLGRYSRKLNDMGDPIAEIADKKFFHYLDALRYVAVGVVDPPQLTLMQTAFSGLYMPKQSHMTGKDYPREQ